MQQVRRGVRSSKISHLRQDDASSLSKSADTGWVIRYDEETITQPPLLTHRKSTLLPVWGCRPVSFPARSSSGKLSWVWLKQLGASLSFPHIINLTSPTSLKRFHPNLRSWWFLGGTTYLPIDRFFRDSTTAKNRTGHDTVHGKPLQPGGPAAAHCWRKTNSPRTSHPSHPVGYATATVLRASYLMHALTYSTQRAAYLTLSSLSLACSPYVLHT